MSIIKDVTLQKIVAHDFRYDPRIIATSMFFVSGVRGVGERSEDTQKAWHAMNGPLQGLCRRHTADILSPSVVIQSFTEVRLHIRPRATTVLRALTSFFQRVAADKTFRLLVRTATVNMDGMDLTDVARHM